MTASILTTAALLLSSLAAAVVLTGSSAVWTNGSGVMIGVGHLMLTAVTIVAALVGAARWAVTTGIALVAALAVPAVVHPIGPAWVVMVTAGGLALTGLLGTGLRGTVRQRPSADGPPRKASALTLGMLAIPLVIGGTQPAGVDASDWLLTTATLALAIWYSQARPSAVWAVRLLLPVMAITAAIILPLPLGLVAVVVYSVLAWLAWSVDARIAVIPLASPGRSVPIPAELAPGEILDAAGLDSRGRPKESK